MFYKFISRQLAILLILVGTGYVACQTKHVNKEEKMIPIAVVFYTPSRTALDSLAKGDENLEESYSDGVHEISQAVDFLEAKKINIFYSHRLDFDEHKLKIRFKNEFLYSSAICVKDSVFVINEFNYEDFINEFKLHVR